MSHVYEDKYYDYIDAGSIRSAHGIIPVLRRYAQINSVLDVGCGRGAWLNGWKQSGLNDFTGVDGAYVQVEKLPFPPDHFVAVDLVKPFDLKRKFDLVQCLEVAEHLPSSASETLVDSLARHGDLIFFSAAVPGQGGEFHVNERPIRDWVDLFKARGFAAWDVVRPAVRDNGSVEPWYRYNSVLFSKAPLPGTTQSDAFPAKGYDIPLYWRTRNALIKLLPNPMVNRLATIKHAAIRGMRRL